MRRLWLFVTAVFLQLLILQPADAASRGAGACPAHWVPEGDQGNGCPLHCTNPATGVKIHLLVRYTVKGALLSGCKQCEERWIEGTDCMLVICPEDSPPCPEDRLNLHVSARSGYRGFQPVIPPMSKLPKAVRGSVFRLPGGGLIRAYTPTRLMRPSVARPNIAKVRNATTTRAPATRGPKPALAYGSGFVPANSESASIPPPAASTTSVAGPAKFASPPLPPPLVAVVQQTNASSPNVGESPTMFPPTFPAQQTLPATSVTAAPSENFDAGKMSTPQIPQTAGGHTVASAPVEVEKQQAPAAAAAVTTGQPPNIAAVDASSGPVAAPLPATAAAANDVVGAVGEPASTTEGVLSPTTVVSPASTLKPAQDSIALLPPPPPRVKPEYRPGTRFQPEARSRV